MLGPSFFLSPGLLQKVYGARDDRAVRVGVLANAAVLFAFAFLPVLLGMIARALHPGLANRELALPMLLVHDLPLTIGSLGLAALVAAEISTADAILFMLSTSLSRDLYQRFLRPAAADADVLRVARITSVVAGVAGVIIAILVTKAVADALGFFYTLLSVSLFVPIVGGLFWRGLGARQALVAMLVGVLVAAAAQFAFRCGAAARSDAGDGRDHRERGRGGGRHGASWHPRIRYRQLHLTPSCTIRPSSALVITPKVGVPMLRPGLPSRS